MNIQMIQERIEKLDRIISILYHHKQMVRMDAPIMSVLRAYPYLPPHTNCQITEYINIPAVQNSIEQLRVMSVDNDTNYLDILDNVEKLIVGNMNMSPSGNQGDIDALKSQLYKVHAMQQRIST